MATVRFPKGMPCTNCGENGHHFRSCSAPVMSYGIIAFRIHDPTWNQAIALSNNGADYTGIPADKLEFLLIQRRDSIGFVELIRAKYKLVDMPYIREQIAGTTAAEREKLLTQDFHTLWVGLWGPSTQENRQYKQEYEQAKQKFESLRSGIQLGEDTITLQTLFNEIPVQWTTPEWGFPKGRRNPGESDFGCANREFWEETGLTTTQYRIFEHMDPIQESFVGNNGIHYCHIYYLAWVSSSVTVQFNPNNEHMKSEIGNLQWFSLGDAMSHIRANNPEKRAILQRVSTLLAMMSPILVGPVAELAEQMARKEPDSTNRRVPYEPSSGGTGTSSGSSTRSSPWKRVGQSGLFSNATRSTFTFVEDNE